MFDYTCTKFGTLIVSIHRYRPFCIFSLSLWSSITAANTSNGLWSKKKKKRAMDWTIHALLHHSGSSWKRRLKANIDWKSQTGSYASAMDGWLCLHSSCIWFPIPVECSASRDEWWWLAAAAAGRAWKQPRNKSCALDRIRCDACAVCMRAKFGQSRPPLIWPCRMHGKSCVFHIYKIFDHVMHAHM